MRLILDVVERASCAKAKQGCLETPSCRTVCWDHAGLRIAINIRCDREIFLP